MHCSRNYASPVFNQLRRGHLDSQTGRHERHDHRYKWCRLRNWSSTVKDPFWKTGPHILLLCIASGACFPCTLLLTDTGRHHPCGSSSQDECFKHLSSLGPWMSCCMYVHSIGSGSVAEQGHRVMWLQGVIKSTKWRKLQRGHLQHLHLGKEVSKQHHYREIYWMLCDNPTCSASLNSSSTNAHSMGNKHDKRDFYVNKQLQVEFCLEVAGESTDSG